MRKAQVNIEHSGLDRNFEVSDNWLGFDSSLTQARPKM